MRFNRLLNIHTENLEEVNVVIKDYKSDDYDVAGKVAEDTEKLLEMSSNIKDQIEQNDKDIEYLSGSKAIDSYEDGIADISPEAMGSGELATVVENMLIKQYGMLNNNAAYCGFNNFNELTSVLNVKKLDYTKESIVRSPLLTLKAHQEGLKEVFNAIMEKINKMVEWMSRVIGNFSAWVKDMCLSLNKQREELLNKYKNLDGSSLSFNNGEDLPEDNTVTVVYSNLESNISKLETLLNFGCNPVLKELGTIGLNKDFNNVDFSNVEKAIENSKTVINNLADSESNTELKDLGIDNSNNLLLASNSGTVMELNGEEPFKVEEVEYEVPEETKKKLLEEGNASEVVNGMISKLEFLGSPYLDVINNFNKYLNKENGSSFFNKAVSDNSECLSSSKLMDILKFYGNILSFQQQCVSYLGRVQQSVIEAGSDLLKFVEIK